MINLRAVMEQILKQITENLKSRRKGGFKKDGSTHHSGIKNERSVIDFLNTDASIIGKHLRPTNAHMIQHKGGTQTKADAVVVSSLITDQEFSLSIKNHKNGTFDWLNSTKGFPEDIQTFLKETTKDIKTSYLEHQSIDITRLEVDKMFSTALSKLRENDRFLRDIIYTIFHKYPDGILIHHEKENQLIYFEKKELKELQGFDDFCYFLKHKDGASSAQIMRILREKKEENQPCSTYLRIRLVLNNGVNALVGTSTKNKTSVPCLKIQQDNVEVFLNALENKKIEKYNPYYKKDV